MSHRAHASFDSSQLASQSPPDLRVRAEMWQGQVPILCHLAPHEVTSMEDPPPIAVRTDRQRREGTKRESMMRTRPGGVRMGC